MSSALKFGRFTVRVGLRPDNPAFAVYLVYCGEILIGKSFSMPDQGCCEWLERQRADEIRYANQSAPLAELSVNKALRKVQRYPVRGRPRKLISAAQLAEEALTDA